MGSKHRHTHKVIAKMKQCNHTATRVQNHRLNGVPLFRDVGGLWFFCGEVLWAWLCVASVHVTQWTISGRNGFGLSGTKKPQANQVRLRFHKDFMCER